MRDFIMETYYKKRSGKKIYNSLKKKAQHLISEKVFYNIKIST